MLGRIVSHLQTAGEGHSSQQHREQGSLFSTRGHQQRQATSLSCIVIFNFFFFFLKPRPPTAPSAESLLQCGKKIKNTKQCFSLFSQSENTNNTKRWVVKGNTNCQLNNCFKIVKMKSRLVLKVIICQLANSWDLREQNRTKSYRLMQIAVRKIPSCVF